MPGKTIVNIWSSLSPEQRKKLRAVPNFFRHLIHGWQGVPVTVGDVSFVAQYATGTEFVRARRFAELEGDFTRAFGVLAGKAEVIADVGSNLGFYSVFAAKKNPSARVFAMEPEPYNVAALKANLAANRLDNVTVLPMALGDQDAEAVLQLEGLPETAGGTAHRVASAGSGLPILTARMDSLIKAGIMPPPQLIKMDIEGYEYKALKGMGELLARHHPDLLIEVHPDMLLEQSESVEAMESYLADLGYDKHLFFSVDPNLFRAWYRHGGPE